MEEAIRHGVVYSAPVEGQPQHVDQPKPTPMEQVQVRGNIRKNEVNSYVHVDEDARNISYPETAIPFGDQSEVQAAMRDPRYKSSAAYRVQVMQRLSVTK